MVGSFLPRTMPSQTRAASAMTMIIRTAKRIESTPSTVVFTRTWRTSSMFFAPKAVITLFTWIFLPNEMIVFGVLHLIGASIILAYPFLRLKLANVALGLFCIAVGLYLHDFSVAHPWFAWLGIRPNSFMLDYWPLFPWFGVTLLGVFAGNALYGDVSKRAVRTTPPPLSSRPLAFLGRHSLLIYFVHQPVLIAALVLLGVGMIP